MATKVANGTGVTTEEAYREHLKRLRDEVEKKSGKSIEELSQERQQRLWDAIEMKEPDRVPVILGGPYFAARYVGLPYSSLYYDAIPWKAAYTKMVADFQPDSSGTAAGGQSGEVLDILEAKNALWPGGTLPPDAPQQAIDGEYMKEDEYDIFLEDTTDFIIRRYLPRIYGALAPLAKIPPLGDRGGGGIMAFAALSITPEFQEVGRTLAKVGQAAARWRKAQGNLAEDLAFLGFPRMSDGGAGGGGPAFDHIANTYRGWKGIVTDMFRRPEKLIAALEKINRAQLARATPADPTKKGPQLAGAGPIHRGSDRFLSKQQWEKFYWPTYKKAIMKSIEMGYMVNIFAEGFCENRFEYFLEIPKGKALIRFTDTDMFKAKEVLGDHFCLMGSVPLTLLQMGSPSEVDEYCKKLIKVCGKGGGYILRTDTDFIQDARPENVRVMVESVKKYRP